jgi:hypothetical protein
LSRAARIDACGAPYSRFAHSPWQVWQYANGLGRFFAPGHKLTRVGRACLGLLHVRACVFVISVDMQALRLMPHHLAITRLWRIDDISVRMLFLPGLKIIV